MQHFNNEVVILLTFLHDNAFTVIGIVSLIQKNMLPTASKDRIATSTLGCHLPTSDLMTASQSAVIAAASFVPPNGVIHVDQTIECALRVATEVLHHAEIPPDSVGMVVYCTSTVPPGIITTPSTILQHQLGLGAATCIELRGACTAPLYAMHIAGSLVSAGALEAALIVTVDRLGSFVDDTLIATKSSTGWWRDGAGALVIARQDAGSKRGIAIGASHFAYEGSLWNQARLEPAVSTISTTGDFLRLAIDPFPREFAAHDVERAKDVIDAALRSDANALDKLQGLIAPNRSAAFPAKLGKALGLPKDRTLHLHAQFGHLGSADPIVNIHNFWHSMTSQPGCWVVYVCGFGFSRGAMLLWT